MSFFIFSFGNAYDCDTVPKKTSLPLFFLYLKQIENNSFDCCHLHIFISRPQIIVFEVFLQFKYFCYPLGVISEKENIISQSLVHRWFSHGFFFSLAKSRARSIICFYFNTLFDRKNSINVRVQCWLERKSLISKLKIDRKKSMIKSCVNHFITQN